MKTCMFLLMLLVVFPMTASSDVVPPEQAASIRSAVQNLGTIFGATDASPSPVQSSDHKSMGDVMDRALTMADSAITQVAQSLQAVAPDILRIFVRQQYAAAFSEFFLSGMIIVIPLLFRRGLLRTITTEGGMVKEIEWAKDDQAMTRLIVSIVCYLLAAFCALGSVTFLATAIAQLINPEYYAIRDLVHTVLGK